VALRRTGIYVSFLLLDRCQEAFFMRRRGLFACLLLQNLASCLPCGAQNLLTNPDLHSETAPWVSLGDPEAWSNTDSLGCVDSGALQVPCSNQVMVENPDCRPYSGSTARIGFQLRGSTSIDALLMGFRIYTYTNASCTSGESSFFGGFSTDIPATFQAFSATFNLPAGTQGVRITFQGNVLNCPASSQIFIDSLYFGAAERILEHDLENGSACPMIAQP
jgi:hypothetical protein